MARRRRRRTSRRMNPRRRRRNPLGLSKKQTKMLVIGAALVGGYMLWKKSRSPAALPAATTSGFGDYVTQSMVDSSGVVSGLGYDVDGGASAFGMVSRADASLYDDTF